MEKILIIFISATLVNNFVLARFLGLCPFIGVSKKLDSSIGMGLAVTFVLTMASAVAFLINKYILVRFGLKYLDIISFILVIATLVQLVEMFIAKISPVLYGALGIYLPLITTNCAVLGATFINVDEKYNFIESTIHGFSAGIGFMLALIIMSSIREKLELADIPKPFRGAPISFIMAGLLSLIFFAFKGLIPE